ncbi:ubiquitin-associated protein 2-like isoform X10 [Phalacrocorax aristotelis]|uniref:ubiquitin-associated protein 2-like isoform X10 n=1 Tax=Phalacrocorax aristotelis TaxID=126867 RepID=UPI003F4B51D2
MMTSVGSERTRGTRDKMQISTTQPTQPQKQVVQVTAEQIRLAQMIYEKNDADFEDKVKQLMEVTGKNQDECIVALHDCNGDVNRAINILLEGSSDTLELKRMEWTTIKETGLQTVGNMAVGEGLDVAEGEERGGFQPKAWGHLTLQTIRSLLPLMALGQNQRFGRLVRMMQMMELAPSSVVRVLTPTREPTQSRCYLAQDLPNNFGFQGAWKNSIEEWTAEDWNEDLSETRVFTASSVPAENHVTTGQSIDLVTLLQKPVTSTQETEGNSFEAPQQQSFGQALVFTNSQHSTQMASGTGSSSAVNSYSPQSLSAVLCSGFGELGSSKLANSTGSQILDQLKSPSLSQFTSQQSSSSSTTTTTTITSSWDLKLPATQSSVLSKFDFKSQPEPSPVLSQLTQRQKQQIQAVPVPPPGLESSSSQVKFREPSPVDTSTAVSKILQLPAISMDNQAVTAHQTQQKQIKPPKRRITPASKIPASAVEMPGSADVTGLNVQFGALEFGSEPALPEFGSTSSSENTSQATNNSLYSKSVKYADPLNTSLPISNTVEESTYTTSAITSSSLTCSSQSTSPITTTSSYDQTSVHSRTAYQSSMAPSESTPVAVMNRHSGVRTQATLDTTSSVPVPKTEPSPLLPSAGSLPSVVSTTASLLPSASQHAVTLPSLPQSSDLASSSLSQLSSSLSNHQSSLSPASVLSSSTSHAHTSVENTTSLQPSTFSTVSTSATSTTSSVVSMASSMNTTNSLGLSVTSVSIPAATTRAAPLVSSGKAPPNLPQGVPPLLHNQYIVGPGGLLPAYPQIYGYDDLQMLQSRLPMDYYGITFSAPATLTGRDGSLANNPYSGDITKFGRGDSASPAPATTLAQPQQNQTQTHHTTQQPFLNPTLPPGYSYTGLPYYAGVPGIPSAFQYGPTMFVPSASAKQHGVNLNTSTPFQQTSGYGQHGYGAGYDDLTQGTAAGDYSKGGYSGSSQAQNKSAGTGPGKGVSVTSSNTGVPDISGSVYNKTQTFDKQGFHTGTPPPFSLPSALGSTGPLNPGAAPGYAPAPFLHILPAHQQPHSQMLHHHLQQDGQGGSGQRNQPSTMQQKAQTTKTAYGTSPYWTN